MTDHTSAENDVRSRCGLTACAVLCMSTVVGWLHGLFRYGGVTAHMHGGVRLESLTLNAKPRPSCPSRDHPEADMTQRGVFRKQWSHDLTCCFVHVGTTQTGWPCVPDLLARGLTFQAQHCTTDHSLQRKQTERLYGTQPLLSLSVDLRAPLLDSVHTVKAGA